MKGACTRARLLTRFFILSIRKIKTLFDFSFFPFYLKLNVSVLKINIFLLYIKVKIFSSQN